MSTKNTFKQRLLHEVEPVCIHGLCGVVSEVVVLMFGMGILTLKRLFPQQDKIFWWMEKSDLFAMLAVVVMFSALVVLRVAIRGFGMLSEDITTSPAKRGEVGGTEGDGGIPATSPVKDERGPNP